MSKNVTKKRKKTKENLVSLMRTQGDSNPCRRRERPVSWASRRWEQKNSPVKGAENIKLQWTKINRKSKRVDDGIRTHDHQGHNLVL